MDLLAHAEIHARGAEYRCMICGEICADETTLANHVQSTHRNLPPNTCALCGRTCKDSRALLKHSWEHSKVSFLTFFSIKHEWPIIYYRKKISVALNAPKRFTIKLVLNVTCFHTGNFLSFLVSTRLIGKVFLNIAEIKWWLVTFAAKISRMVEAWWIIVTVTAASLADNFLAKSAVKLSDREVHSKFTSEFIRANDRTVVAFVGRRLQTVELYVNTKEFTRERNRMLARYARERSIKGLFWGNISGKVQTIMFVGSRHQGKNGQRCQCYNNMIGRSIIVMSAPVFVAVT